MRPRCPFVAVVAYLLSSVPLACQRPGSPAAAIDSAARGLLAKRAPGDVPYDRFGARLFAGLAQSRGSDSNTVISPLSAGMALALVAAGANGATYDALTHVIGADLLNPAGLARRDSLLLFALSARKDVVLEIANALWLSPRYTIQPSYVAKAGSAYRSQVRSVALNTAAGVATVNAWAKEKTHGKIPLILDAPLSDTTAVVVTNAVYFRGVWLEEFAVTATRPLDFHSRPERSESVPGMERTGHLAYLRGTGMQVVRLPYRGGKASLFVLLPDTGVRIENVESRLAESGLSSMLSEYQWRDVHLRMPRVHAEASMDLKQSLKLLGATIAFTCEQADFRSMLVLRVADQRACIGDVKQKTFLDIDEKGTVAAAVTAVSMSMADSAEQPQPPIEFIVDRPFLFVLRDEVSGVPLFMGRIVQPGTTLKLAH
jgi:serine protease inhibitor